MKSLRLLLLVMTAAMLSACAGPAPLPAKSAVTPVGVDLTGRWQLLEDNSSEKIAEAERKAAGLDEDLIPSSRRKHSRRKKDDIQVNLFLEAGTSLKITQTDHGLFVSFDRAIVEEYRFGEQRSVNIGPVVADRVSGWEDNGYVIVTRGKEGGMLIETYRLDGEDRLVRTIRIHRKDKSELDVRQLFDRV